MYENVYPVAFLDAWRHPDYGKILVTSLKPRCVKGGQSRIKTDEMDPDDKTNRDPKMMKEEETDDDRAMIYCTRGPMYSVYLLDVIQFTKMDQGRAENQKD